MPVSQEIISDLQPMSEVLLKDDFSYFIPDFQRNFVWGQKEIDQLFRDFDEDTNHFEVDPSNLEGYLLGNIVLISDDSHHRKIVVDGQQRLTTLSLIAKAIFVVVFERIQSTETSETEKMNWLMKLGDIQKGLGNPGENGKIESLRILVQN